MNQLLNDLLTFETTPAIFTQLGKLLDGYEVSNGFLFRKSVIIDFLAHGRKFRIVVDTWEIPLVELSITKLLEHTSRPAWETPFYVHSILPNWHSHIPSHEDFDSYLQGLPALENLSD